MLRHSLFLLVSSVWLLATETPPPPKLSLDDIVRLAWQNDPHADAIALASDLARAREVQAGIESPPEVALRASLPASGDSEWSMGVGVSRTFARRERLELARAYARLGAEASAHHLRARRLALADTVRRLSYELAVNEARAAATRRTLESLRELSASLAVRHAAGEVGDAELDLLALEQARLEQALALVDAETLGGHIRLRRHLRLPDFDFPPHSLKLETMLARPVPPDTPDADDQAPALALAALSQREAEAALALAQARSQSEWTLGAGIDVERTANDATGRLETTPVLGLSASRPWQGATPSNHGDILEKRADTRLAEARRSALGNDLAAERAAAIAAVQAARPALARHRELLERAAALPARFAAAFARGEITATQLAQARQQVHAVEVDYLSTAARYLASLADAEAAAGVLPASHQP